MIDFSPLFLVYTCWKECSRLYKTLEFSHVRLIHPRTKRIFQKYSAYSCRTTREQLRYNNDETTGGKFSVPEVNPHITS